MSEGSPAAEPGEPLGGRDLHVHTTMSDGELPLERVVEVARERGVAVGIADHVSTRTPGFMIGTLQGVEAYLAAMEGLPVFRSAEFCWCDELWAALPDHVHQRFDYRLGSNHGFWLPDGTMASPWWALLPPAWAARSGELMEIMVDNLCDLVRSMPIEIVAHSTLLPPALLRLEPDVEAWWTEEREDRFIEATLAGEVAIEISARYRLPHPRLLRKARQAGARFSLGSDGHREHQIGRLEWAIDAARAAGITAAALFTPAREPVTEWS